LLDRKGKGETFIDKISVNQGRRRIIGSAAAWRLPHNPDNLVCVKLLTAYLERRPLAGQAKQKPHPYYLQCIDFIELPVFETLLPAGRRRSGLGLASVFGFEAVSLLPLLGF